MEHEIAILDFGSQYTHLIARRVRELGIISHIYPNNVSSDKLKNAVGIILSGGPRSLIRDEKLKYDKKIFDLNIPVLGLCYGHQIMADLFEGKVEAGTAREYGQAKMQTQQSPIFEGVNKETVIWMSHGDHVAKLPTNFKEIASTENNSITAMANEDKNFYGFQFHPEVHHSKEGKKMLSNFVFNICKAKKNWDTNIMLENIEEEIKKQAGDKNVFLLVSGGVDSTVCFALLKKTLGKNKVYGMLVDHGLMRQNETLEVREALKNIGLDDLHVYSAEDEYLDALKNIYDPEEKRKIIGDLFLKIADRVMVEKGMDENNWLLGQGTIYPDTIESGDTKNSDVIKTHHNRVPKIQEMIKQGKIIEPIKELYKDEVREIGLKLGLPENLIFRHPFPGPGLGIRCLCSNGEDGDSPLLSKEELGVVYVLPIKSVGVQGDERSYAHPALITGNKNFNDSIEELQKISPELTNKNKNINRVLFLISGDKSKLLKSNLSKNFITKTRLDKLRKLDEVVNKYVLDSRECKHIWQLPVVLLPYGHDKKESLVLRPVESEEAMTVSFAQIPKNILDKIIKEIEDLNLVDFIFYDITNKPPGTIEWE